MLRGRLPDQQAEWPDPIMGINLRDSLEDLKPGEADRMANMFYDGGIQTRTGSKVLNTMSQGAFMGRGGIRVYPLNAAKFRMIAFSTKIMTVSDAGAYGTVTFTLTSDQPTFFRTWTITDKTYVCNNSNVLSSVDSTQTFATVTGTNIPASPTMVCPFLDRLFAIQGDGVYSSNPRTDNVWAPNTSTWAIYRPSAGTGNPVAVHLHSLTGNLINPQAQLLIFQENSLTALTGTDLGSDVTLVTPPSTWNATMTLLSPIFGTKSPASIVSVPGVGTFWFTQNAEVAWLQFYNSVPKIISDKLVSNRTDVLGIKDVNFNQLAQVRMVYQNRKLKLYLPVGSNAYSTIQYWLDIRQLQNLPELADMAKISWSGPHTGQSLSAVWVEQAGGDPDNLYGCEGQTGVGMYVYQLNPTGITKDAVGAVTQAVQPEYRSFFNSFGAPSFEKWVPLVRFNASGNLENVNVALFDLHGNNVQGLTLTDLTGAAFTTNRYKTGLKYQTGYKYGSSKSSRVAVVDVASQSTSAMLGDAIQVRVTQTSGSLNINSIRAQAKVRRDVPVS